MLHVHNGDSAADTARISDLPGEHLAWREALVCGPAPGGLSGEEFRRTRAAHLSSAYGVRLEKCERELREQEETLASFTGHEEVVLWFESDLFAQVQLIYLLDGFARRDLVATKLSLICVGDFDGIADFRGLGQLNATQLSSLFPRRLDVTPLQLRLGSKAWRAYVSPDPAALIDLLGEDLRAMPFLKSALLNHLRRFPSTRNGLGSVGNAILELIAAGARDFGSLFEAFARRESGYGFGDAQLHLELKALAGALYPPLSLSYDGAGTKAGGTCEFPSGLDITMAGKAILEGGRDFIHDRGIDLWLGGVHLAGDEADWRWDEYARTLIARG